MLSEQLRGFGFNQKQTAVFLCLMEEGPLFVTEVAKKCNLNRSTVYVVLDWLCQKGFVRRHGSGVQKYESITPNELLGKALNLAKNAELTQDLVDSMVPTLQSLSRSLALRPRVVFYEGKEGVKNVHEALLSSKRGSTMFAFSVPAAWENLEPGYYTYLRNLRIKRGIKLRAVHPHESGLREEFRNPRPDRLAEFLFLPRGKFNFRSDLRICENKVALSSAKEEFGVIIENQYIADSVREMFGLIWDHLKAQKSF